MSSFPKDERMPFGMMIAMSFLWNTEFLAFYDENTLCGLIYLATIGCRSFIMFFAVDKTLRNKDYGSQILEEVRKRHPKNKIIVSIEPCSDNQDKTDIKVRRRNFYLRNGYLETGYYMKLRGQAQEILVKNRVFNKSEFIRFFILYSNCTAIPKVWRIEQKEVTHN